MPSVATEQANILHKQLKSMPFHPESDSKDAASCSNDAAAKGRSRLHSLKVSNLASERSYMHTFSLYIIYRHYLALLYGFLTKTQSSSVVVLLIRKV